MIDKSNCSEFGFVIPAAIDKVYDTMMDMQNNDIPFASFICLNGSMKEIGSVFKIEFKDGKQIKIKVLNANMLKRSWTCELIDTSENDKSIVGTMRSIRLSPITDENKTYIHVGTLYANEISKNMKDFISERNDFMIKGLKQLFAGQ